MTIRSVQNTFFMHKLDYKIKKGSDKMSDWNVYLREINMASITMRLLLICLFSGIVGIERGTKQRPAGFRTHMLVGVGSTMVMMTGQYMTDVRYIATDASRLGAQVISGIGFLGAGTIIIIGRNQVKGLTTAAGLWACACMGLVIGIGFYEAAIIGGLFLFFIIMGLNRIDGYVRQRSKILEIYVELEDMTALSHFIDHVKKENTRVSNLEIRRIRQEGEVGVNALMTLTTKTACDHTSYVLHLHGIEGVMAIEEII